MNKKSIFQIGIPTIFVGIIFLSLFTFGGTSETSEIEETNELSVSKIAGMFLTLTGETSGVVRGGATASGREDSIEVWAFTHSVVSPRDTASGLPTGKKHHKPITITKSIDVSSPILARIHTNNENIVDWSLRLWEPSSSGKAIQFYTIELVNAQISSISQQVTLDGATERVSFTYQKIIWTWEDGGITAEDDWEVPIV